MSNFKTFGDLSTTAASNTLIDSNNVDENCAMSGLNNAIRALGAAGKGTLTAVATSGTDTYTATLAPVPDALATDFLYYVNFASTNTSTTPTLNLNAFGAKTITDMTGGALVAGSLNGRHLLNYDGANFRVLNPALIGSPIADATNGGLNVSANKINLKPSDLLTKAMPTTADSILIQDAAASNAAKTATIPAVVGALFSPITNSLGANVALNNIATYFDGPSVAQGTTGTWLAMGTVTVTGTALDGLRVKLWDGTTIIASCVDQVQSANLVTTVSLSGFIASPAGNLRVSVLDFGSTSGLILSNQSGNSKDSTITAIRIA